MRTMNIAKSILSECHTIQDNTTLTKLFFFLLCQLSSATNLYRNSSDLYGICLPCCYAYSTSFTQKLCSKSIEFYHWRYRVAAVWYQVIWSQSSWQVDILLSWNVHCRLYNAHWQEELIYSQVQSRRLCDEHATLLHQFNTVCCWIIEY